MSRNIRNTYNRLHKIQNRSVCLLLVNINLENGKVVRFVAPNYNPLNNVGYTPHCNNELEPSVTVAEVALRSKWPNLQRSLDSKNDRERNLESQNQTSFLQLDDYKLDG